MYNSDYNNFQKLIADLKKLKIPMKIYQITTIF